MCATDNNFVENTFRVSLGDTFFLELTSDYPQNSGHMFVEAVKVWFSTRTQSLSFQLEKGASFKECCKVQKKNGFFHPAK